MSVLLRKRKRYNRDFDREQLPLLRRMLDAAAWRSRWDYNGWSKHRNSNYTQKEWNQTLVTKINEISAQIHKCNEYGSADTLSVSPEALCVLEDLEYFVREGDRMFLGRNRNYEIHVNKYMQPNAMIVCRIVIDPEEWFENNRMMGVIMLDGIRTFHTEPIVDDTIKIIDRKYLPLSLEL